MDQSMMCCVMCVQEKVYAEAEGHLDAARERMERRMEEEALYGRGRQVTFQYLLQASPTPATALFFCCSAYPGGSQVPGILSLALDSP